MNCIYLDKVSLLDCGKCPQHSVAIGWQNPGIQPSL